MSLFIHIGAPRTGTSFLRKYIFDNLKNVKFYNKENVKSKEEQEVVDFFSQLAHMGDGDELSASIENIKVPIFESGVKIIISEEHFIWSVYHMMGNIGSRALLLKRFFKNAKIILTVRRQPEYYLSIFKYLNNKDNSHIKNQMKSIFNMLNIYKKITHITIYKYFKIPVGVNISYSFDTYDVGKFYFDRKLRHFLIADMSWLRIYDIYANLFGKENVLVLPQEMLLNDKETYLSLLTTFMDTTLSKTIINNNKVNTTPEKSIFKNRNEEVLFINFILNLTFESNQKLDSSLSSDILKNYNYYPLETSKIKSNEDLNKRLGFITRNYTNVKVKKLHKLQFFISRIGLLNTIKRFKHNIPLIIKSRIKSFGTKMYYKYNVLIEKRNGLDLSSIENIETLGLDKKISEQYETTKIFELKRWIKKLPEDIKYNAIDFGSGKGSVLIALSNYKKFENITGVEISKKLTVISEQNLKLKKCQNVKVLTCNALNTPAELISSSNFFFFYNPFPYDVFEQVFKKIELSLKKEKRQCIIVYFNPLYKDIIEVSTFFNKKVICDNILSSAKTYIYMEGFNNDK
jgi:hypothetical protein